MFGYSTNTGTLPSEPTLLDDPPSVVHRSAWLHPLRSLLRTSYRGTLSLARLLALKPSFLLWRYATLCALVFGALSSCLLAPQGPTKSKYSVNPSLRRPHQI